MNKVHKQYGRKKEKKGMLKKSEELSIRYHDVNPEWNYTISPRLSSKLTKQNKK